MSKIYTKTGDKGKTSLFNGQRILKSQARVVTYGEIDELNSLLGVVASFLQSNKKLQVLSDELIAIQNDLFAIGASLANPAAEPLESLEARVLAFEGTIDALTVKLAPLSNFILPGGGIAGSFLHYARTVCRSVERQIVDLSQAESIDIHILTYFNRLSDLLFTYARYANKIESQKEIIWSQQK